MSERILFSFPFLLFLPPSSFSFSLLRKVSIHIRVCVEMCTSLHLSTYVSMFMFLHTQKIIINLLIRYSRFFAYGSVSKYYKIPMDFLCTCNSSRIISFIFDYFVLRETRINYYDPMEESSKRSNGKIIYGRLMYNRRLGDSTRRRS